MHRLLFTLSLTWAASVAGEAVYGDEIAPKDVSESVEACEYDLLIEKQTCNRRINKSECIREIHRYCLENFSDLPYPGPIAEPDDSEIADVPLSERASERESER